MANLADLTSSELLRLHGAVADELRARGVVRSANNPVGDLAEYLFCKAFGWELAPKSAKAADAIFDGKLYQIKGRRLTKHNGSRQLGAMRGLSDGGFDYLAAVLFNTDYSVLRAAIIPHASALSGAKFIEHTNSWKFILRDAVWICSGTEDVTNELRAVDY